MSYWNGSGWEAEPVANPPRPRRARRLAGAATEAGLITLLMFGLIAGSALAAPGGGRGGGGKSTPSSIILVILDGSDASPNHAERVGFIVATSATDRPFVGVRCWQGSAFVLDGYAGYFDDYMFEPWVWLDSPYWDATKPADCTARLFRYDKRGEQKVLATIDFLTQPQG